MDVLGIAKAVFEGVVSIPVDAYYGFERTLEDLNLSDGGRYYQRRNAEDNARFGRGLKKIASNPRAAWDIASIIVNDCFEHLPDSTVEKIYNNLSSGGVKLASRQATQLFVVAYVCNKIVGDVVMSAVISKMAKLGIGLAAGALVTQGLISRAAQASRSLLNENPKLYYDLLKRDLDMFYFLFEEPLKQYIELGKMYRRGDSRYEQVINEIERMG